MHPVTTYDLLAPAKINLSLHVLGRRDDGFHDIASWMVPISLADRLLVTVGGEEVLVQVPGRPDLEGDENLCAKAAHAFRQELDRPAGVAVVLEKRIPVAGGLGGGSSDAAAILRCLALHHGVPLQDPRLAAAALRVGSDVPFFLQGEAAIASGRGERLEPAPLLEDELHFLILQPSFGVSAREAYDALAALRASALQPEGFEPPPPRSPAGYAEVIGAMHNDLEPAVATFRPIESCKERLRAAGAPAAMLSGSGSCVFAVARRPEEVEAWARSIRMAPDEGVHLARTLRRAPEPREAAR